MCPNCRAFITTDDKICPYCEVQVGPKAVDRRPAMDTGGMLSGPRFVTSILLLVNLGLFAATLLKTSQSLGFGLDPSGEALVAFGAKYNYAIVRGEWWRLITAGFLHGGILHILMNMWVLFDLGPAADASFGTNRFLVIYSVSNVTGFLASFYWSPVLSIGASAALCGLIGAMIALGTREKHTLAGAMRGMYIKWVVVLLVFGFLFPGVDNAAHVGGLIGGFGVGYVAGPPTYRESTESLWRVLAMVCLAVTAYAFVRMFLGLT